MKKKDPKEEIPEVESTEEMPKGQEETAVDAEEVQQEDNLAEAEAAETSDRQKESEERKEPEERKESEERKEPEAPDVLEALEQKYNELNDSYLRLHAEFDNFRKRTLKEKAELIKSGGERVLTGILSLVDDMERALASLYETSDKDAIMEGMELIHTKFITFLKQQGVQEMEAIGQPFDADRFEAVTTIPVEDASRKGCIVDCIQKGYQLNDKIIRFPKVIVGE